MKDLQYEDVKGLNKSLRDNMEIHRIKLATQIVVLRALGVDYPDVLRCFCPLGTGHPGFKEHTQACQDAEFMLYNWIREWQYLYGEGVGNPSGVFKNDDEEKK